VTAKDSAIDVVHGTAHDAPFTPIERAFIDAMVAAITKKLLARYAEETRAATDRSTASRRRA
jgi:hypothetical protein